MDMVGCPNKGSNVFGQENSDIIAQESDAVAQEETNDLFGQEGGNGPRKELIDLIGCPYYCDVVGCQWPYLLYFPPYPPPDGEKIEANEGSFYTSKFLCGFLPNIPQLPPNVPPLPPNGSLLPSNIHLFPPNAPPVPPMVPSLPPNVTTFPPSFSSSPHKALDETQDGGKFTSVEETAPPKSEADLGVFGSDGCWYPLPQSPPQSPTFQPSKSPTFPPPQSSLPSPPQLFLPTLSPPPSLPHNHSFNQPLTPPFSPQVHSDQNPPTNDIPNTTPPSQSPFPFPPPPPPPPQSQSPSQHHQNYQNQKEHQPTNITSIPLPYYNYFHHLDLPMSVLGRPRLLHTYKRPGQLSVEDLWMRHMAALFRNLPDSWTLTPTPRILLALQKGMAALPTPQKDVISWPLTQEMNTVPTPDMEMHNPPGLNWHVFRDLAKVRFYCGTCGDGWTSMYGVVIFHYSWDPHCQRGLITYKVSGQKCVSCQCEEYKMPMWYPEEAQKVITNLYYRIASHIYNLVTPQFIRTRRIGQPTTHHNQKLCQGCGEGVCKLEKSVV